MVELSQDELEFLTTLGKVYYEKWGSQPDVTVEQLQSGALLANFKATDGEGQHPDMGVTFPPKD